MFCGLCKKDFQKEITMQSFPKGMVCSNCICEAVNVAFKLNANEIKITTNKMNLGY